MNNRNGRCEEKNNFRRINTITPPCATAKAKGGTREMGLGGPDLPEAARR